MHNFARKSVKFLFLQPVFITLLVCVNNTYTFGMDEDDFPKTIEGFGYKFNEYDKLVNIETGEPYKFDVKNDDHDYNQRRYEALGNLITNYVYGLLEREVNLKRVYIPERASVTDPRSFIFMSENALTEPDKLLILINGSGAVRAGQWARSLIINDCLDSGTQLPFIKRGLGLGYAIMVLNTNENYKEVDGKKVFVQENENPENHVSYVWKNIIRQAKAKNVAIVAHSYGGVATINMLNKYHKETKNRVFAVAFTDSVHSLTHQKVPQEIIDWLRKIGQNWVSSSQPLDTPITTMRALKDIPHVSAGHMRHEMTSWSSFSSIFEFLEGKYQEHLSRGPLTHQDKKPRTEF